MHYFFLSKISVNSFLFFICLKLLKGEEDSCSIFVKHNKITEITYEKTPTFD